MVRLPGTVPPWRKRIGAAVLPWGSDARTASLWPFWMTVSALCVVLVENSMREAAADAFVLEGSALRAMNAQVASAG